MAPKAKQKRSQDRINKILNTAEEILDTESMDSLTIARISHIAELKRTSTYKFFQTPESNYIFYLIFEYQGRWRAYRCWT